MAPRNCRFLSLAVVECLLKHANPRCTFMLLKKYHEDRRVILRNVRTISLRSTWAGQGRSGSSAKEPFCNPNDVKCIGSTRSREHKKIGPSSPLLLGILRKFWGCAGFSVKGFTLGNASLFTKFLFTIFAPLNPPPPNRQNDGFSLEFLLKEPQTELRTLSQDCEQTLQKLWTNRIVNKRAFLTYSKGMLKKGSTEPQRLCRTLGAKSSFSGLQSLLPSMSSVCKRIPTTSEFFTTYWSPAEFPSVILSCHYMPKFC